MKQASGPLGAKCSTEGFFISTFDRAKRGVNGQPNYGASKIEKYSHRSPFLAAKLDAHYGLKTVGFSNLPSWRKKNIASVS